MNERIVPGLGPLSAPIALVGDAPGADEERLGEPFVGPSGKLLTQMLAAVGVDRKQCYVDNVSQVRPLGNDFRARYYQGKAPTLELVGAREALVKRLQARAPVVTVALGEEALRALTGLSGIGDWRGSILRTPVGKVVPTYHPSNVLRMYEHRRIVEHDLARALQESQSRELVMPGHQFTLDPTFDQAIHALELMIQRKGKISFDIETLGSTVRCIALADIPWSAICIPFVSSRSAAGAGGCGTFVPFPTETPFHSHWPEDQELEILKLLNVVLSSPDIPLIAQNFPFDASFLEREFGIVCRGLWMDTMVAQHCCYSELPKGLDFLCSFYTRVPCYWKYDASSDLSTWKYNCYDAAVTFEVALVLEKELKELEGRK
jgi:uracil-DNA glycosylase family 4